MDAPRLSVIVPSYNSVRTIRACLNSLRQQDFPGPFEVIVVDSSTDGTGTVVRDEFPEITLVVCCTRKFPAAARNIGIARARGDVICFLDSDCIADGDWLTRISEAHSSLEPVIGGCIDNAAGDSIVGWSSYFAEFSRWMPGMPRARVHNVPSCNLTFKRWILDELGPLGPYRWGEDTAYNLRLRRAGYPGPLFDPAIAVAHDGITHLTRFLAHELDLGEAYGRVRVSVEGFDLRRRIAYALAVPLIHLVLCWRTTFRILGNRRFLSRFIRVSPLVFLGLLAWTVGEGLGYVRGKIEDASSATYLQEECF